MGAPLRVIMVEGSPDDALLLARELRRGGYEPVHERVESAEELRRALEIGPWDVIISDYDMPGFGAADALRMLQEHGTDAPFVVVSGPVGEEAAVGMIRAGASDYVMKDMLTRLSSAIARELREAEARRSRAEAEARYRSLVEQIPAITYIQETIESKTPKAVTYVSPQYETMFGYSPGKEMLDEKRWLRTLHPDDRDRVMVEEDRTDATGEPFEVEYRVIAADGRVAWVRDQALLVRDEGGHPLYWQGVQLDITGQKRAEEALRESEERYRIVAETASDAIVMIDEESRILFANGAAEGIFGHAIGEMLGQELTMLMPERLRKSHLAALKKYLGTGRKRLDWEAIQLPGLRKNGGEVPIEVSFGEFVKDGSRFFTGFIRDISERKKFEEDLRQSEERFRLLAEMAVEGIVLSENGRVMDANPSFARMFGYDLGEVAGMSIVEFVPPEDREPVSLRLSSGDLEAYEIQGLKKNGDIFPLEARPRSIPYHGSQVRVTSVMDLTERKLAGQRVREAREAERVRIAQDIHDDTLQSMIYALQEIQLLQITAGEDGGRDSREAILEDVADALRRSVEGLRSAIFELRLEDALNQSFTTSLQTLVELTRRMSRNKFELSLEVDEGFPPELSPRAGGELVRILQEALNNARRHSASHDISVRLWREGGTAFAEVADDGKGFDADASGGGVGMSSMRRRAVSLGGELTVQSEPGSGTRVRFEAPIARLLDGQASV